MALLFACFFFSSRAAFFAAFKASFVCCCLNAVAAFFSSRLSRLISFNSSLDIRFFGLGAATFFSCLFWFFDSWKIQKKMNKSKRISILCVHTYLFCGFYLIKRGHRFNEDLATSDRLNMNWMLFILVVSDTTPKKKSRADPWTCDATIINNTYAIAFWNTISTSFSNILNRCSAGNFMYSPL